MPNWTKKQILDATAGVVADLITKKVSAHHVGFGYKEDAVGAVTSELAIRVYVDPTLLPTERAKILPSYVFPGASADPIPVCVINAFPDQDVPDSPPPPEHHDLESSGKLVKSGIAIGNDHGFQSAHNPSYGTLGFFAQLKGVAGPDNVVGVTNSHVLSYNYAGDSAKGNRVYKVCLKKQEFKFGEVKVHVDKDGSNPIGTIGDLFKDHQEREEVIVDADGNTFKYKNYYYVDGGIIRLTYDPPGKCDTSNQTVNYINELRKVVSNPNAPTAIKGIATLELTDLKPSQDYKVHKVGAKTGYTTGRVIDARGLCTTTDQTVIVIEALNEPCNEYGGEHHFSAHGDSGAALLNEQDQIVGIVYATDPRPGYRGRSYACHIDAVFDALKLVKGSFPTEGPPKANSTLLDASATVGGGPHDPAIAVRESFRGSKQGRHFLDLYQHHRHEIVHLVNHSRRVTVVWHRNKGPAYLNRAIHGMRDPDMKIPREIDGVSRETLLRNMAQVLDQCGSDAVKELVASHLDEALAYARAFDTVREFVDLLAAENTQ